MTGDWLVDGGTPAVFLFSGPDAVRYLNGQVTQDVRKVVGSRSCLPAGERMASSLAAIANTDTEVN